MSTLAGDVHPDHRGQGIGSQLVPTDGDRAHDYVRERGPDLRPVIIAQALSNNTDLAAILDGRACRRTGGSS